MVRKIECLVFGLMCCALQCAAQDQTSNPDLDSQIESIRADYRANKVSVITDVMEFTAKESSEFWPIYRRYDNDLTKLDDERISLVKSYATKYRMLTNDQASELAEQAFDFETKRLDLRKQYYDEFSRKLPAKTVAKFFQLEHRLDLLIDVEIASQLPMVMKATASPQGAMPK